MGLFIDTERQAIQLVEDVVRRGNAVRIHGDAGGDQLFRDVAARLPREPVIVHVGSQTDAHVHAILSAAAQCGRQAPALVARALRDGRDVDAALKALEVQMHGRYLLVNHLERLTDCDELGMVFAKARQTVADRLADRAKVQMITSTAPAANANTQVPAKLGSWDSGVMWSRCGGDVDLFELAAARMLTLRAAFDGNADLSMLVHQFWLELEATQRHLIGLLLTHRRAMPRGLLMAAHLAEANVIEDAVTKHLLHESSGELTLPRYWERGRDSVLLEERAVHRRIASAFEAVLSDEQWGPLATLEAHRHYTEIPDLACARQHAAYGVEMLLDLGRRLSLSDRRSDAASTYRTVITLDEQESAVGSRVEPRALAYAIHYEAYNLYKQGDGAPPIDRTIARYREALNIWPENALFWSRLIAAYFIAERFDEALRARTQAYAAVPPHPERDRLLVGRTVNKLVRRGAVVPAALAMRAFPADAPLFGELRDALLEAWSRSIPSMLWSPAVGRLGVAGGASLRWESERFVAAALDREGAGVTPAEAMAQLIDVIRVEFENLASEPGSAGSQRRHDLVEHLRFDRASPDEGVRWLELLGVIVRAEEAGRLKGGQRDAMLGLWGRLRTVHPTLRRPSFRMTDEGTISLAWSYAQPAGFVFTVDFDGDGRIDWYLRDPTRSQGERSESLAADLPEHVIERLAAVTG